VAAAVLLALDPASGAVLWNAPLAEDFNGSFDVGPFTSEMAIGFGRIHVQHMNFSPLLSTKTGKLLGNGGLETGMDDSISPPLIKSIPPHGTIAVTETWGEYYSEVDDHRHTVFAWNVDTGRVWRQPIGQPYGSLQHTPALANGHVFTVNNDENRLIRIDASTGSIVWSSAAGASQLGSPAVYQGRVFLVRRPNTLQAYDELTGSLLWETAFTGETASGTPLPAPVVGLDSEYVVLNKAGGGVAVGAFDRQGTKLWGVIVGPDVEANNAALLANGILYLGNTTGRLFAIDAGTGETLSSWQFPSAIVRLIVVSGRVHVATEADGVHTLALPS
jgi:outer membrane protein assembly factor BamB